MRLFSPIFSPVSGPREWVEAHHQLGYRAAKTPLTTESSLEDIRSYREAAASEDLMIAEVGCWSNPLSDDEKVRREAVLHCKRSLELAERLGAKCCVNIAGSRSADTWAGPDSRDLSEETLEMIVFTLREIIDAVKTDGDQLLFGNHALDASVFD